MNLPMFRWRENRLSEYKDARQTREKLCILVRKVRNRLTWDTITAVNIVITHMNPIIIVSFGFLLFRVQRVAQEPWSPELWLPRKVPNYRLQTNEYEVNNATGRIHLNHLVHWNNPTYVDWFWRSVTSSLSSTDSIEIQYITRKKSFQNGSLQIASRSWIFSKV